MSKTMEIFAYRIKRRGERKIGCEVWESRSYDDQRERERERERGRKNATRERRCCEKRIDNAITITHAHI